MSGNGEPGASGGAIVEAAGPPALLLSMNPIDPRAAYQAITARDARFDGVFFTGVISTGIYCRPVCPVKTPLEKNCRFFSSAGAAEKAGFRPCLRCRPELAPGLAPVDSAHRIAHLMVNRVNEGLTDDNAGLEQVAAQFGISSRQLRRIVKSELGISPIELLQTRRLLLAKQLLTDTKLPVIEVAFASGFSSLRRFNDAFQARYRMPPARLRREAGAAAFSADATTSTLRIGYRPPFDWDGILAFLHTRTLAGVEHVTPGSYARTVRLGKHTGWIRVTRAPEKYALAVEFTHSLTPVLPALLGRLRNLFDLEARPDLITAHLGADPLLADSVRENPGLRVPGAFHGFELAVRAILGQQITVRAATTIAGRFTTAFGEKVETPFPELSRLTPGPHRIARASIDEIARLGVVSARAASLIALAGAVRSGDLRLEAGAHPDSTIARLTALPGIGLWTAHYIAMRVLRWPDAFPKEDIALRNRLGGVTAKQAEQLSLAWRPWRSYAVLHLWRAPAKRADA